MKIYKYIFRIIIILIIMWLITNIVTNTRVLFELGKVEIGTVLERFYFINIASKIYFLLIIGISLKIDYKLILGVLFVPIFWLLHAYINIGKFIIETEYLVLITILIVLFYLRERFENNKVVLLK